MMLLHVFTLYFISSTRKNELTCLAQAQFKKRGRVDQPTARLDQQPFLFFFFFFCPFVSFSPSSTSLRLTCSFSSFLLLIGWFMAEGLGWGVGDWRLVVLHGILPLKCSCLVGCIARLSS